MSGPTPDEVSFTHVVLEGTPYEVGRLQGQILKKDPKRVKYLTPPLPFLARYSRREAHRALEYFDRYCPGIGEEIQGAAEPTAWQGGLCLSELTYAQIFTKLVS